MKKLAMFNIYPGENNKPVFTLENGKKLERVSRWISVKENYTPGKNNSLWDYVTDENGYKPYQDGFNPENGLYLDYFKFAGRTYAIEQFFGIGSIADMIGHSMGYIENGERHYLSGFDSEDYYNPLYIEIEDGGEHVRLYREVVE